MKGGRQSVRLCTYEGGSRQSMRLCTYEGGR